MHRNPVAALILLLCLPALTLRAAEKLDGESPQRRFLRWSQAALVAGASADVASSWGAREGNPLLRGNDGRFGSRGASIKLGMIAGGLTIQYFTLKRHPEAARSTTICNVVAAGALGGLAARNARLR
jgi:hypothetical protein